jgi:putative lipoic acid-binding regulatory protein
MNSDSEQLNIEYPCKWQYKIIGKSVEDMISAVEDIVVDLEYDITPSNISSNEKYYSLNLQVMVPSEIIRNIIYQKLTQQEAIKFVL